MRSNHKTPSAALIDPLEARDLIELCPQAGVIARNISERISEFGGAALIADYGHNGDKQEGTFRAFKGHQLFDPLELPGTADLTADVDFSYLRKQCMDSGSSDSEVICYGPVNQYKFLHRLGIKQRKEALVKSCSEVRTIKHINL